MKAHHYLQDVLYRWCPYKIIFKNIIPVVTLQNYFQRLLPVVTFQIGYSSVFINSGDLCYSFNQKVTPVVTLQKSDQFSQLNCTIQIQVVDPDILASGDLQYHYFKLFLASGALSDMKNCPNPYILKMNAHFENESTCGDLSNRLQFSFYHWW